MNFTTHSSTRGRDFVLLGSVGFAAFLGMILLTFGSFLTSAWILMLILGALHHSVTDVIPAVGYWVSLLIVAAFAFLKGLIK